MRIKVTDADIQFGARRDSKHCPIALAFYRQTGLLCTVGYTGIQVYRDERTYTDQVARLALPKVAKDFIHTFDAGAIEPKPFEFDAFK